MGEAKKRGSFEERKAEAVKKQEDKAAWLAKTHSMGAPDVVRPQGTRRSRSAIMATALAVAAGVSIKKE